MDYLFDEVLILHKGRLLLKEEYETLVSRGITVTGPVQEVDDFSRDQKIINQQQLGGTKAVTIYAEDNEELQKDARWRGLEIGHISLQDLFIHLTEEEDNTI